MYILHIHVYGYVTHPQGPNFLKNELIKVTFCFGGVCGLIDTIVGNEHSETSSNRADWAL